MGHQNTVCAAVDDRQNGRGGPILHPHQPAHAVRLAGQQHAVGAFAVDRRVFFVNHHEIIGQGPENFRRHGVSDFHEAAEKQLLLHQFFAKGLGLIGHLGSLRRCAKPLNFDAVLQASVTSISPDEMHFEPPCVRPGSA